MSSSNLQELRDYLYWLITPQDDKEKELFRSQPGLVDEHCSIANRIDTMTEQELVDEINHQLEPYGFSLASTKPSDN